MTTPDPLAAASSPPTHTPPTKVPWAGLLIIFCVTAMPFLLIGPGVWLLAQRAWGTRVEATVLGCTTRVTGRSISQDCTATWTEDGQPVVGPIEGSGDFEAGRTVGATVRGGTAYSRSLSLPLVLIGLGIPFCIVPFRVGRSLVRKHRRRRVLPTPR